ncbi:MAG: ATP-binding cassette domain-containing protein [Thaumarchaeota archaeon]|nr:ATP-binding cassette domain-containing protein [Nitrososphaerota archaeon]
MLRPVSATNSSNPVLGRAASDLIEIKDLNFKYFGSTTPVLQNVNLTVKNNEIVLIAGHSGSGKSTLLRAINGLIPHQHSGDYSGEVLVDGLKVSETSMSVLALKVGYIFQNPENQIFMFSVERDVAFGLENLALPQAEMRERVDWAMELLQIKSLALRAPHELSDGQKQRVAIAGVLAMKPKILILDEPTSLLDPFTAKSLVNLIRDLRSTLGITVLIVEHRLDLVAKICDRMVVVDKGTVVLEGSPREILSKTDVSLFGVTEPTIVKLSKRLSLEGEKLALDAQELTTALKPVA